MATKLIGRQHECDILKDCMSSDRSEFVIVYGRRRIGKTFLVDQYYGGKFDFTFVGGHNLPKKRQLSNFGKALKAASNKKTFAPFKDWFDAFDALEEHLASIKKKEKKTVFIDEMPWIDNQKSEFVAALENFWNGWAARRGDIMFIATGSASSWMMDKIVDNKGGLHARITNSIYLRPFTLAETEEYLVTRGCQWDRYQITQCYMIMGGVPYYLSLIKTKESLVQNIDRLFFADNAILKVEFDELYNAVFDKAEHYIDIVHLLYKHKEGMTRTEIAEATGLNGGMLSKILRNLVACDFVCKSARYGSKSKNVLFRLIDFYTLFYYKFVSGFNCDDNFWWTHHFQARGVETWMGISFELLCQQHTKQIKKALGISGIPTETSFWRKTGNDKTQGTQIDLIIERSDRMIHLCEIKFSRGKYTISKEYEELIKKRIEIFRNDNKANKGLICTFITTNGISKGKHSSIVDSEVTMEDLFA